MKFMSLHCRKFLIQQIMLLMVMKQEGMQLSGKANFHDNGYLLFFIGIWCKAFLRYSNKHHNNDMLKESSSLLYSGRIYRNGHIIDYPTSSIL